METSLRLVLLLVGFLIVAGIVWDAKREKKGNRNRRKHATTHPTRRSRNERLEHPNLLSENLDDVDLNVDSVDDQKYSKTPLFEETASQNQSSVKTKKPVENQTASLNDMVILSVMARQSGNFSGKRLLELFHEAYLYYGDRQIFHRYDNNDGTGQKVFSIALAVEPGFFDLSQIETLTTPGITLFFTLTRPNQSIAAFEQMLRSAKLFAMRLDGELRDDRHRMLTVQTIEQYRERVRTPVLAGIA